MTCVNKPLQMSIICFTFHFAHLKAHKQWVPVCVGTLLFIPSSIHLHIRKTENKKAVSPPCVNKPLHAIDFKLSSVAGLRYGNQCLWFAIQTRPLFTSIRGNIGTLWIREITQTGEIRSTSSKSNTSRFLINKHSLSVFFVNWDVIDIKWQMLLQNSIIMIACYFPYLCILLTRFRTPSFCFSMYICIVHACKL